MNRRVVGVMDLGTTSPLPLIALPYWRRQVRAETRLLCRRAVGRALVSLARRMPAA
jgi:hypothetical protein